VRATGTGLHLLLFLHPAVELYTAGERQYWSEVVRAVQCTLPVDPDCPGITALTRPVGSSNSKNAAMVRQLKAGRPVTPDEAKAFLARVAQAPFKEVALPLLGAERVRPCPVCGDEGTELCALDHFGKCYQGCGKVNLGQLYDSIFVAPAKASKRS
jgi:hypothetical protein